jgi:hypothetical protein
MNVNLLLIQPKWLQEVHDYYFFGNFIVITLKTRNENWLSITLPFTFINNNQYKKGQDQIL